MPNMARPMLGPAHLEVPLVLPAAHRKKAEVGSPLFLLVLRISSSSSLLLVSPIGVRSDLRLR